jgi:hypothetical protein
VFGSVARGEDTESSDVDILIDLADGVGVVGLVGLERELSEILERPADVVPAARLNSASSGSPEAGGADSNHLS